jgi:hypothetical protein
MDTAVNCILVSGVSQISAALQWLAYRGDH